MVAFRQGEWAILSVEVDETSVFDQQGFQRMELMGDELTIRPSGLKFKVQQSTSRSAVLESHGQVFFADYLTTNDDNQLSLKLSRPQFSETIRICAEYDGR